MAPAHTPLSPSPKPIELPILPIELQDLLDSVTRRLIDLETYQIQQLSSCKGPLNLHEQIANSIRIEIVGIKRDLEELKLLVDDLDRAKDKRAGEFEVVGINSRLISITKSYREAVLISKRSIDSSVHLSARDELFLNASKSGGTSRIVTESAVSPDDALMNATSDVTEGLRRTMQLMQQELDRSLISNEILESSTATMQMTSDQYSTFSTLLSTSKALITSLERADFLDRLILLFAVIFFVLSCAYVFKRRVVDKGIRVAGALSRVVAGSSKSSTPSFNNDDWDSVDDYGVGDVYQSVIVGTATLAAVVEAVTQRRRGRMREIKIAEPESVSVVKPVAVVDPIVIAEPVVTSEPVVVAEVVEEPVVSIPVAEVIPAVVEEVATSVVEEVVPVQDIPVVEEVAPVAVLEVPIVAEEIAPSIPETIVEIPVVEKVITSTIESVSTTLDAEIIPASTITTTEASSVPTSELNVAQTSTLKEEEDSSTPLVQIQLIDVPDLLQKPLEHPLVPAPVEDLVAARVEEVIAPVVEESVVVPFVNEVVVPFVSEVVLPVVGEVVPLFSDILVPVVTEAVIPIITEAFVSPVKSEILEPSSSTTEASISEPSSNVSPQDVEAMIALLRNGATPSSSPQIELPSPDNLFPGYGADESIIQKVQEVIPGDQDVPTTDSVTDTVHVVAPAASSPIPAEESPSASITTTPTAYFDVESSFPSTSTSLPDTPLASPSVSATTDLHHSNPSLAVSLPYESIIVAQLSPESIIPDTYPVTPSPLPSVIESTTTAEVSSLPPPLPTTSTTILETPISVVFPIVEIPSTSIEVPSAAPATPPVAVVESTPIASVPSVEIPVVSTSLVSIPETEPVVTVPQVESIWTPVEAFPTTVDSVATELPSVYPYIAPQEVGTESTPLSNTVVDPTTTIDPYLSSSTILSVESIATNSLEQILPDPSTHPIVKPFSHFGIAPIEEANEIPAVPSPSTEQPFATVEFTPPIASPPFATPEITYSATPSPLIPPSDISVLNVEEISFSSSPSPEVESTPPIAEPAKSEPIVFLEPTLSLVESIVSASTPSTIVATPLPDTLVVTQDDVTLPLVEIEATPSMYSASTASTWGYHTFDPNIPTPTHLSEELPVAKEFGNVEEKTTLEESVVPSIVSIGETLHQVLEVLDGESELPHGAEIVGVQVEHFQMVDGVQQKVETGKEAVLVEEDKVIGLEVAGVKEDVIPSTAEVSSPLTDLPTEYAEVYARPSTTLAENIPVESAAPVIKRAVVDFLSSEVPFTGKAEVFSDIVGPEVEPELPEWMRSAQADMLAEKEAGAVTIPEVDFDSIVEDVIESDEAGSFYRVHDDVKAAEKVGEKEEVVVAVTEAEDLEEEEWNRMLDERRMLQAIEEKRLLQPVPEAEFFNVAPVVVRDEL